MRITRLLALTLLVAACGGDAGPTATTALISTTAVPDTATTTAPTTSVPDSTSTDLPGEPIDFGPRAGDTLAVIGVAHDDVLNLREGPGPDERILAEIPNLADDLTALGNTRDIGEAFWIEVEYQGTAGWVHLGFIGYLGVTDDATAAIIQNLGERPMAETMLDLGTIVAESLASDEPPSDMVMVLTPSVGDLGEVTFDVIGLGDDAVRGLRVHVFGQPEDEFFVLDAVEVTPLCGRGVTDEGLCI